MLAANDASLCKIQMAHTPSVHTLLIAYSLILSKVKNKKNFQSTLKYN